MNLLLTAASLRKYNTETGSVVEDMKEAIFEIYSHSSF
jgi:hypothetical protein